MVMILINSDNPMSVSKYLLLFSITHNGRELTEVKSGGLRSRTREDFTSVTGFHCG